MAVSIYMNIYSSYAMTRTFLGIAELFFIWRHGDIVQLWWHPLFCVTFTRFTPLAMIEVGSNVILFHEGVF